jgi:hypothetical protein
MMIVRFRRRYGPYSAGERAGFDDQEARRLLADQIAESTSAEYSPAEPRRRGRPRKNQVEAKPEPDSIIRK